MLEAVLSTKRFRFWASEYARVVAMTYAPDCVILFGSTARNQHTLDSDIDILVVGGNLPNNHRERFRQLIRLRPPFAPLQVQTFTRAEWEQMMAERHVTVLEALKDGVPLHGQTLFARWRRTFRGWLRLGLQRTDSIWIIPPALRTTPISKEIVHG